MIRWNRITIAGREYIYEYRQSWGKVYYSFDSGATWHRTKTAAFRALQGAEVTA